MLFLRLLFLLVLSLFIYGCSPVWNSPNNMELMEEEILFSSFASPPKNLDPVISYNSNEWVFSSQILEPLLQYHYFKIPYQIEPLTLAKMPKIIFLNAQQQPVKNDEKIVYTRYYFTIKDNIYYQPHPAFAKDNSGNFVYHNLSAKDVRGIRSPLDFNSDATRLLTVDDYIYAIKRMAIKQNHSPILTSMQRFIVGLETYSKEVSKQFDLSQDYTLKNNNISGVVRTSDTEFSILINGVYPQFIYWLTMNFFAPMPWEVIAFYNQQETFA